MSKRKNSKDKNKKDKNKKIKIKKGRMLFLLVAIIFLIITIRFYSAILSTKMLPSSYIIVITSIEAILTVALILGLTKKHKTLKLNIFCLILILIFSAGYTFATHYIDITMEFLNKILTELVEVENYYVIVRKDSSYDKLEDIKDNQVSTFQIEDDVREKIQKKVTMTLKAEDNLTDLGTGLLQRTIDVIIISSSQYNILAEEIDGFKENTKIIATETHKIENQARLEDANSNYVIGNGIFNIYISGVDVFGDINKVARTDANMLVTVNVNTHEILLTSIPRDYYVTLHSKKAKDKLTHSGIYGIKETVTTVEDFLDVDINYYVRVNFTTVMNIIDAIGGIDVESDYSFYVNDPWEYKRAYSYVKGNNHLSGEAALAFSRERNSFKDGDNQRVKNQQKVIEAVLNKVLSSRTLLTKYSSMLDSLAGSFNTNMTKDEISTLVKGQLAGMPKWKITHLSLTGSDALQTTYSLGSQEVYVMIPNQNSIKEAKTTIKRVMGE